jgi:probable F420-dependent oxidoreductase
MRNSAGLRDAMQARSSFPDHDRTTPMLLTTNIPHGGPLSSPAAIRDIAQAAEDLGFDGIGFYDHLALPRQVSSLYDLGPSPVGIPEHNLKKTLSPLYECLATMAWAAGATKRVRLDTGVLVLPLRNPVYNARQIATIDALSGGRVDLGIGAGWLKEEAEQMQMPWDARGARTDEHIQVLRLLWESNDEYVSFKGRFYQFEEIDPRPHPAQKPLPIWVGGHTPAAKARAGRLGNGWVTARLDIEAQAAGMEEVRRAAVAAGRDPAKLQWAGSVDARYEKGAVKSPEAMRERLRAYRSLGMTTAKLSVSARSLADHLLLVEWLAKEILPEFRG